MSIITWRWYKINKQGALLPFNDKQPHVPNEPVKAGCLAHQALAEARSYYAHVESGRVVYGPDDFYPPISHAKWARMIDKGEIELRTTPPIHDAPVFSCTCGHYVFKWSEDALALPRVQGYGKLCKVFAAVEVWGRLIEHDLGYRAEYSTLRGICSFGRKVHPVYEVDRARTVEELVERWEVEDEPEDLALPEDLRAKLQHPSTKEVTDLTIPEDWWLS